MPWKSHGRWCKYYLSSMHMFIMVRYLVWSAYTNIIVVITINLGIKWNSWNRQASLGSWETRAHNPVCLFEGLVISGPDTSLFYCEESTNSRSNTPESRVSHMIFGQLCSIFLSSRWLGVIFGFPECLELSFEWLQFPDKLWICLDDRLQVWVWVSLHHGRVYGLICLLIWFARNISFDGLGKDEYATDRARCVISESAFYQVRLNSLMRFLLPPFCHRFKMIFQILEIQFEHGFNVCLLNSIY